jgi:PhnB protein
MPIDLNPYISFKDSTRDAMTFYQSVFGGDLRMSTFEEFQAPVEANEKSLIMHAELTAPNGLRFMASDTPSHMEYAPGKNFSMSLSGDDAATLRQYFDRLAEGGEVSMPLDKAPWGDTFGMCTDRFGISWLVNISGT